MKAQDLKIFMRQAELKMETKALWVLILTWADRDGTNAYPTIETLAHVCGMKERWVKHHLAILKKKGYVVITKGRMKGARYDHNIYALKTRCTDRHPTGCTGTHTTKSLNQKGKVLSVESEAILRVVPRTEETPSKYGLHA